MLKHTSLLHVVNESENVLVDKLWRRSSTSGVGVKIDFGDPSANFDLLYNAGKPEASKPFLAFINAFIIRVP
jgi:hypothetical protein